MTAAISQMLGLSKPQNIPSEPTSGGEPSDAIVLISFPRRFETCSSATPFGGKVELMLRIAGLPYVGYYGDVTNKNLAPRSKFPVMVHGDALVADSSCIFTYLENLYPDNFSIFTPSDPLRRAHARAFKRMLEEGLYYVAYYLTWQRDDFWADVYPSLFPGVPFFVPPLVRSIVLRDLHGQGTGRHSFEHVLSMLAADLGACEAALTDSGAWLTGDTPTEADCFFFGILDNMLAGMPEGKGGETNQRVLAMIRQQSSVMMFHQRVKDRYYADGPSTHWTESVPADVMKKATSSVAKRLTRS